MQIIKTKPDNASGLEILAVIDNEIEYNLCNYKSLADSVLVRQFSINNIQRLQESSKKLILYSVNYYTKKTT